MSWQQRHKQLIHKFLVRLMRTVLHLLHTFWHPAAQGKLLALPVVDVAACEAA